MNIGPTENVVVTAELNESYSSLNTIFAVTLQN